MGFSEWLYGLGMNRMRFGLDNISELLKRLGDPQKGFKAIHVAGSDGKGSVCAMIYSVLREAGISAGMYTSPHLVRFNERISVNGNDITDAELEDIGAMIRPAAEGMLSEGYDCTFFEAATAAAFMYFQRKKIRYAVLETGLGGRLDATNVVHPVVTAITNISKEHADILGDTIEKIAFEKAGIIKKGVPVITANTGSVLNIIKNVAKEKGAPLMSVDPDVSIMSFAGGHAAISYLNDVCEIGIPGRCQAENAAVAIECVRRIGEDTEQFIKKGLKDVRWRGRMEYFPDDDIMIDVTHTAAGAERLSADITETYGKVILIVGMLNDKSADLICASLSKAASEVIVTSPNSERAMPAAKLAEIMNKYSDKVSMTDDVPASVRMAKGRGTVLITGSLHTAGEAMTYLKKM